PWNADTLEWSVPTPMPDYSFRRLPVVHSRHPLWEEGKEKAVDPKTQKLLNALTNYPLKYRSQLVTTAIDAQPEEVYRIAGPSIWPLLSSLAIATMTLLLVFSQYALAAVALIATFGALAGWH